MLAGLEMGALSPGPVDQGVCCFSGDPSPNSARASRAGVWVRDTAVNSTGGLTTLELTAWWWRRWANRYHTKEIQLVASAKKNRKKADWATDLSHSLGWKHLER